MGDAPPASLANAQHCRAGHRSSHLAAERRRRVHERLGSALAMRPALGVANKNVHLVVGVIIALLTLMAIGAGAILTALTGH